ncbi:RsmB/NOP family class I SAM-dependent RNA methyltransferase [Paenibacillus nasutitermitis]|uniref:tRNA/rRNA methyltransferase n=1 Tax=Paenibacillus nasutitermitis TaxID=1652958 RepID=A0A916YQ25_9BACL|nr:RsmB/NOP family class I SAM-dependent RNA methyltransferase [Paenibacillus nasutitermitis]GGD55244.1 tRNA/rRNA methyltransferase [Paenibacillus nasutitermitis]
MPVKLPEAFSLQMQQLLPTGFDAFIQSYDAPRTYGLRMNPFKLAGRYPLLVEAVRQFRLESVPWCTTGYYYDESTRPGKHPYHAAGLYYIQEPSAMTAAELLEPQPGEFILDMAAAPGGKTTQIAGKMLGRGILVANEIHPARAKILSENAERCGIANIIVTCASPEELSRRFAGLFDRIMLDAPCSGEGMFRKDEAAVNEWSESHVAMCAARQKDILDHAAILLKPGGRLVYSTCTFNRQENEEALESFCAKYPLFSIVKTERVWPHEQRGEGHFIAVLQKASRGQAAQACEIQPARDQSPGRNNRDRHSHPAAGAASLAADMALAQGFIDTTLPGGFALGPGEPLRFGDALYWLPHLPGSGASPIRANDLNGLKVPRPGLHLGDIRKNRLEPGHALAMAVPAQTAAWMQTYPPEAPEIAAYLHGETLAAETGSSGWGLVAVDGLPLGWGKASSGLIKNHLPKGLRRFSS